MEFFNYFATKFKSITIWDIIAIVVIATMLYVMFSYIIRKKAQWLVNFQIMLFLLVVLFCAFVVKITVASVLILLLFIALISIIIFATDIKRDILRFSWKKHSFLVEKQFSLSQEEVSDTINKIVKASQSLSKQDIGALIVIAPDSLSDYVLESGTLINAKISSELLEALFFPKSPLHDGAVIVKGDIILAAGCYLPLSQATNLPKEWGTRHRAAIGITETNPTLTALVVSEETGIISVMYDGKSKRYLDTESITSALECAYNIEDERKVNAYWRKENEK